MCDVLQVHSFRVLSYFKDATHSHSIATVTSVTFSLPERKPSYIHLAHATTHGVSPHIFVHINSLGPQLSVGSKIVRFGWVDEKI